MSTEPITIISDPNPGNMQLELLATATAEQAARAVPNVKNLAALGNVYLLHQYTEKRHGWFLALGADPLDANKPGRQVGERVIWRATTGDPMPAAPTIDDLLALSNL